MIEEWRDVVGFEDCYQVSNLGKIKRTKMYTNQYTSWGSNKILIAKNHTNGYKTIILSIDNIKQTKYIHRLVAQAFICNPNKLAEVNHIDGNKANNFVHNLEWVTHSENGLHAYKTGLRTVKGCYGNKKKVAQLNIKTNEVLNIYNSVIEASQSVGLLNFANISACCNYAENNSKYKKPCISAKGFKWRFADNDMKIGDIVT